MALQCQNNLSQWILAVQNYEGSFREPTVMPAKFPNLLVNGAGGIAVHDGEAGKGSKTATDHRAGDRDDPLDAGRLRLCSITYSFMERQLSARRGDWGLSVVVSRRRSP